MLTGLPAEAMGWDDEIGSLRPGRQANFIVLKDNPLQDLSSLARPETVVKGGQIAVSQGMMATPDGA
jgi:imidazolonepropionase-like amidohydrolase